MLFRIGGTTTDGRTNDVTWLSHDQSVGIWDLVNHIADAVGLPLTHAEPLQVVHYKEGQQYRQHWMHTTPIPSAVCSRSKRAEIDLSRRLGTSTLWATVH